MNKRSTNNSRTPKFSKSSKDKATGFTKKSELKGWKKPKGKAGASGDEDSFRFKKPGSKGKELNLFKEKKGRSNYGVSGKTLAKRAESDEAKPKRTYTKKTNADGTEFKKPYTKTREERFSKTGSTSKTNNYRKKDGESAKPFVKKWDADEKSKRSYTKRTEDNREAPKSFDKKWDSSDKPKRSYDSDKPKFKKPFDKDSRVKSAAFDKKDGAFGKRKWDGPITDAKPKKNKNSAQDDLKTGSEIRLNRYLSNAGVASRREADELIGAGLVSINGTVVTEMGAKVKAGDVVKYNNSKLSVEPKVYVILNKPKDVLATTDDPEGRKTVKDLFKGEISERIFSVGRMDRNTTGVLFFTNDGELALRLSQPKYLIKKVYKVTLDKNFKTTDLWNLANNGVTLEDGFIKPEAIAMPSAAEKNVVGVEIYSGKNQIIPRMFESIGYRVERLDRALFGTLDKARLKRGEFRHLTEKELKELKKLVHLK